jgi:hypothetical protein
MTGSTTDPPGPQAGSSLVRGRRFLIPLALVWPAGLLIGAVAMLLGAGVTAGIAVGLAVALCLDFLWLGVAYANDDDPDATGRGELWSEGRVVGESPADGTLSLGRVVWEETSAHPRA